MQKYLLTTVSAIALGISATAAMAAGSSSYDTQEGTGQIANIDQSGGAYDQVGTAGTPFDQNNGASGTGGNTIQIIQTGSYNTFGVSAASLQSGTTNGAIINQAGYNSGVELQQTGTNNGAAAYGFTSGDTSNPGTALWWNSYYGGIIAQDSTSNSSNVSLTQNGTSNIFDIGQGGVNNTVTATQIGGTNELYVRQGTTAFPVWYSPLDSSYETNSTITVYQNGGGGGFNVNYAALAQGGGNANSMTVTQVGYANSADVNQSGSNNIFTSYQGGSGNFVGGESGWPVGATFVSVPIAQTGTGNQYYNTQVGTNAIAMASQVGDFNYVSNYQSGDSNTISGSQNGTSNQVYSWQTGVSDTLTYTQNGSNNFVSNNQSGSGNSVMIKQ